MTDILIQKSGIKASVKPGQGIVGQIVPQQVRRDIVGIPGPSGSSGGSGNSFGWVKLSDSEHTQLEPQTLDANVRTLLENNGLNPDPDSRLTGTFAVHDFLVENRLRSLSEGDSYDFRLSFFAESTVMNNELKIELDVGGAVGVIQTYSPKLAIEAGEVELITANFMIYALDTFLQNGAGIFVTSKNPMSVWGASWFIRPEHRA